MSPLMKRNFWSDYMRFGTLKYLEVTDAMKITKPFPNLAYASVGSAACDYAAWMTGTTTQPEESSEMAAILSPSWSIALRYARPKRLLEMI